jgi:hypothetical protein
MHDVIRKKEAKKLYKVLSSSSEDLHLSPTLFRGSHRKFPTTEHTWLIYHNNRKDDHKQNKEYSQDNQDKQLDVC